jgi:hypothetical protein
VKGIAPQLSSKDQQGHTFRHAPVFT